MQVAPAPGPSGAGTVNARLAVTTNGALSAAQQMLLCQIITGALASLFPSITQCTVSSQIPSAPAPFATSGRRLNQASLGPATCRCSDEIGSILVDKLMVLGLGSEVRNIRPASQVEDGKSTWGWILLITGI